tara:strand:- start:2579 stop:2851 length:273 start_codon:yes stop_codon:yes gene_type:complete
MISKEEAEDNPSQEFVSNFKNKKDIPLNNKASFELTLNENWHSSIQANTIVVRYEEEDWRAMILPNEPAQVKEGFEYTIKLLHKVDTHDK